MTTYRNTASFGKRQEFLAMSELLKRGYDVYTTMVDDQGIDCIVRINEHVYLDVQIKARSKVAKNNNHFGPYDLTPRKNYFYLLYREFTNTYYFIPSHEIETIMRSNKSGKNIGKFSMKIPKREEALLNKKLAKFKDENGFAILENIRITSKI